jgi:Ca2+-binding EF-hand superfamily protein
MTGFSARTMPVVILLFAVPMQAQTQKQAQRFPAFDPERIFMLGDADLDGRLSLDEYRDFLRSSPRMRDAMATIEPMFRRLDADRDEFLSMAEYRKSFPRRPGGTAAKPDSP